CGSTRSSRPCRSRSRTAPSKSAERRPGFVETALLQWFRDYPKSGMQRRRARAETSCATRWNPRDHHPLGGTGKIRRPERTPPSLGPSPFSGDLGGPVGAKRRPAQLPAGGLRPTVGERELARELERRHTAAQGAIS